MTGLEALEQLFQGIKSDFHYEEVPDEYRDYFTQIHKELKAFEILKNNLIIEFAGKMENLWVIRLKDHEELDYDYALILVPKEKYDLLKEELEDEQKN